MRRRRPTVPIGCPDDRPTLAAFADWWLPRRRVRGRPLAPNTVAYYRVLLRLHILPTVGRTVLADLTRGDVRAWYDALQDERGAGAQVTRSAAPGAVDVHDVGQVRHPGQQPGVGRDEGA